MQNADTPGTIPDRSTYTASDMPVGEAYFWIIGRPLDTTTGNVTDPQWGLVDEASKLNLNTATQDQLMNLPGMTQDFAAAIVSWRGGTAQSGTGNTSNTYSQHQPPYHEKQAPFDSIEELAMLDGADPSVLASQDLNLNGVIDSYENDAKVSMSTLAAGNPNGPGIWEYVTVFSKEPVGSRIPVKGFPTATNGGTSTGKTTTGTTTSGATSTASSTSKSGSSKTSSGASATSSSLMELLQQNFGDAQAAAISQIFRSSPATSVLDFYERSGLKPEDFQKIEKQLITSAPANGATTIQGLVNVNTAPVEVLIALGMSDTEAASVVSARQGNSAISGSNLTPTGISWLKGVLQKPTIDKVGPYLTGQSYIVSADIAAVGRLGRGYRRTRFVFDGSSGTPKVIYRRNLSSIGWALGRQVRDELTQERGRM
jgi:DNA uptake protein ComE-like DNA-binding protein